MITNVPSQAHKNWGWLKVTVVCYLSVLLSLGILPSKYLNRTLHYSLSAVPIGIFGLRCVTGSFSVTALSIITADERPVFKDLPSEIKCKAAFVNSMSYQFDNHSVPHAFVHTVEKRTYYVGKVPEFGKGKLIQTTIFPTSKHESFIWTQLGQFKRLHYPPWFFVECDEVCLKHINRDNSYSRTHLRFIAQ